MQSTPTLREMYPHRELGIILLILGALLIVLAVVIGGYNQCSSFGMPYGPSCVYPYAAGGALLGLLGLIFLIVGVVLAATRHPSSYPTAMPYYAPAWNPYPVPPPPPPAPMVACKGCGRVYHVGQFPFCPNCGSKLGP